MQSTFFLGTVNPLTNEPREVCQNKYAPVLIIDDSPVNRRLMTVNLKKRLNLDDADFSEAETAEDAINLVKEDDKRFKLYIIDHHLTPDESPAAAHTTGEHALTEIKKFHEDNNIPLGFSIKWSSDEESQKNTVADARLAKPMDVKELENILFNKFLTSINSNLYMPSHSISLPNLQRVQSIDEENNNTSLVF